MNNGSIYIHTFVVKAGKSPNPRYSSLVLNKRSDKSVGSETSPSFFFVNYDRVDRPTNQQTSMLGNQAADLHATWSLTKKRIDQLEHLLIKKVL